MKLKTIIRLAFFFCALMLTSCVNSPMNSTIAEEALPGIITANIESMVTTKTTNLTAVRLVLTNRTGRCVKLSRILLGFAIMKATYIDEDNRVWGVRRESDVISDLSKIDYDIVLKSEEKTTVECMIDRVVLITAAKGTYTMESSPIRLRYRIFEEMYAMDCRSESEIQFAAGGYGYVNLNR